MSFLTRMLATVANPADERYWSNVYGGPATVAGVNVSAESALKLSAWWACDRLLCETVGSLPAIVFERLADGGRQRATNHPLYDVLHRQPNEYQTPIEFFDFMTHSAAARGNGFAKIIAGPRGFADQLKPLHPDHVTMDRLSSGNLRYTVREPGKQPEVLSDSEVLHLKGMSADGITGMSVISYARESLGLGLAAENYSARFLRNDATPGGVLEVAGKLSPDAATRMSESWRNSHGGAGQHTVAVLEEGATYKSVGLTNKDSQLLESREFQAEDVCRWWRTPPHMVGLTSKATSWGSGIEQMGLGFITYTLMPWLVRWQQAISRDLILAPNKYFVEFITEALLRGDTKGRYDAYAIGIDKGWLSPNDVRRTENMNPRPGGDVYAQPGTNAPAMRPLQSDGQAAVSGDHYMFMVRSAAARVVRKEVAALGKAVKRGGDWAATVSEFYSDHAEFVAQTLGIAPEKATAYVEDAQADALTCGPAAVTGLDDWYERRVAALVALVMEAV